MTRGLDEINTAKAGAPDLRMRIMASVYTWHIQLWLPRLRGKVPSQSQLENVNEALQTILTMTIT